MTITLTQGTMVASICCLTIILCLNITQQALNWYLKYREQLLKEERDRQKKAEYEREQTEIEQRDAMHKVFGAGVGL